MQNDKYLLSSLSHALDILDLLNDYEELSLAQILKHMNVSKAAAFRLLYTLEHKDYVVKSQSGKYSLNIKFARFGARLLEHQSLLMIAKPYLEHLRNTFNETAHLSILSSDNRCVIIHKETGSQPMQMSSAIGAAMDIFCSATGKIITANLDKEIIDKKLNETQFVKYTENTKTNIEAVKEDYRKALEYGYAADLEERDIGLVCYACPIFDINKKCVGAVSLSGKANHMLTNKEAIIASLKEATNNISAKLGYKI